MINLDLASQVFTYFLVCFSRNILLVHARKSVRAIIFFRIEKTREIFYLSDTSGRSGARSARVSTNQRICLINATHFIVWKIRSPQNVKSLLFKKHREQKNTIFRRFTAIDGNLNISSLIDVSHFILKLNL